MGVLILGGEVVTASDRFHADVYTQGEIVAALLAGIDGAFQSNEEDVVLDASGCYVIPGGVDVSTYFEWGLRGPVTVDDFEVGTMAGLCGGTTTVVDHAAAEHGETLMDAYERRRSQAEDKVASDYSFHMVVTDWDDDVRKEVADVRQHGISSFAVSMASRDRGGLDDAELLAMLQRVHEVGGLAAVRALNGIVQVALADKYIAEGKTGPEWRARSQPVGVESEAIGRASEYAALAEQPLYVTRVSSGEAVARVREARRRDRVIYAGTCPHYLLLSEDLYDQAGMEGAKYLVSPPLRSREDQAALWAALSTGSVQVVCSDHAAFTFAEQKSLGLDDFRLIPDGMCGVQERLSLMFSYGVLAGRISLNQWVQVCCTNPAKIFGLYPRKGTVAVGADADLVIFDPNAEGTISAETHMSQADYNPYGGFVLRGLPRHVLLRGQIVVESGEFRGEAGSGRFLQPGPSISPR
jgi:dihydropyrimidinase